MAILTASPVDIDDGPPCPDCGGTRWLVEIGMTDFDDGDDRLVVQLHVQQISCADCGFDVDIADESDLDSMRWTPDPSDESLRDLP